MPRKYTRQSPSWPILLLLLALVLYLGGGCSDFRDSLGGWLEETFGKPTPRERYLSDHRRENLENWNSAYRAALTDSLLVDLPHREIISVDSSAGRSALSYLFTLSPGRLLTVSAAGESPLFGELYVDDQLLATWDTTTNYLSYEAPKIQQLKLIVQSLPGRPANYELLFTTIPVLEFPVAGKDASAIQSFWGASRDGGRRRHEGNDIFAARGTPVVATTAGRVSRVREGGIGGKTVWLRDGEGRGVSYYYAHLDEQLVNAGATVQRGDTLGLVGNTGNARTTPPHLHFGIYANGARDPFPYLRPPDDPPIEPALQMETELVVPNWGNHYLRQSPERDGKVLRRLDGGEVVIGLGISGRYHRIQTTRNESGYVNFD